MAQCKGEGVKEVKCVIYITVTESEDGAGIQQILVEDILYMQLDNQLIISVYTQTAKYFTVGNLRFWASAFEKAGLNFLRLDRGVLANSEKIRAIDSYYKMAYFDVVINKDTIRCTMSITGYKAFCEIYNITQKGSKTAASIMFKGLSWQTSL